MPLEPGMDFIHLKTVIQVEALLFWLLLIANVLFGKG